MERDGGGTSFADYITNVWSAATPDPVVIGTNNVVSGSTRFYRLRR